jgi:hypothetical protein
MSAELKKLVWFLVTLSIFGMILSFFIISPESFWWLFTLYSILTFVGGALIIVAIAMLCTFVMIIVTISIPISRIGEYYEFKGAASRYREPLMTNFKIVFWNNILMTIPIYFAFMYLLNPSNFLIYGTNTELVKGVKDAFIASVAIIPGYLLSIRLLTHPVRKESYIPAVGMILALIRNHYSKNCSSMEVLKERFISFYFSLTASAFFIMAMIYLYKSIPLSQDVSTFWMNLANSLMITFIPSFDPNPMISIFTFLFYWCAYLLTLAVVTLSGELILYHYQLLQEKK